MNSTTLTTPAKKENRVSVLVPHLIAQLHPTKNGNLDSSTLTIGMDQSVWWLCNNCQNEWLAMVRNRAKGQGCMKCSRSKRRKRPIEVEEAAKRARAARPTRDTISIGDATEDYVKQLLEQHSDVKSVEKWSQFAAYCDLVVEFQNGSKTQVQVKTLSKRVQESGCTAYYFPNNKQYVDKMLIAMVDIERTKFGLEYAGNLTKSGLVLNWNSETSGRPSKYSHIMYSDSTSFLAALVEKSKQSEPFTNAEDILSESSFKEYNMYRRLQAACVEHNIECKRNETNGNTVDGTLNGVPIQMKFTSFCDSPFGTKFSVSSKKAGGVTAESDCNARQLRVPYHADDPFEYIVIEIGTEIGDSRHPGSFCILPKSELIAQDILTTANTRGHNCFSIAAPDHVKEHWSKPYWDRWDFFTSTMTD